MITFFDADAYDRIVCDEQVDPAANLTERRSRRRRPAQAVE
jgi:hypothetical protein